MTLADANVTLRSALDKMSHCALRERCNGLDLRGVVELLLDTFLESPVEVGFQRRDAEDQDMTPITVRIRAGELDSADTQDFRLDIQHLWGLNSDKKIYLSLKEIAWADGSHESDWRIRDEHLAKDMSEVIGWVSWVKDWLPELTYDLLLDTHSRYKMPNLQALCWRMAPVGIPPFNQISLSKATYEVAPTTRWSVTFPRPWRAMHPYAYVRLLPDPTGKRSDKAGLLTSIVEKAVAEMEDKAVEILRGHGHVPPAASPLGWGDPPLGTRTPISEAIYEGVSAVVTKTNGWPSRIQMNPLMLHALLKERTEHVSDSFRPAQGRVTFRGIELTANDLVEDGTVIFSNANNDAFHSIHLTNYRPKNRDGLPQAPTN